jgi:hypothetical protein
MNKWISILLFLVSGLALLALSILVESKRSKSLSKYWSRDCMGSQWMRRFPAATKEEIRAFLDLFVKAFLFARKRRLSFSPDDQVMDVYRASYPPEWTMSDAMELEIFSTRVRKVYGIDIVPLWHENITLGELFALTHEDRPA